MNVERSPWEDGIAPAHWQYVSDQMADEFRDDHDPGDWGVGVGGGRRHAREPMRGSSLRGFVPPGGRVAPGDLVARTAASRVVAANSHTPTPTEETPC